MNLKKIATEKDNIKIFGKEIEKKISNIQKNIENKKELSFLHFGHLGDVVNSLPIIKDFQKLINVILYTDK